MSLKLSVLLSAVVATLGAGTYNYDRCDIIPGSDGAVGPLFWGILDKSACGTILSPQQEGTPINLCGASAFPGTAPTPVVSASYSAARTMNASNTGSSLYWYVNDNAPTLQMGNLAYVVNRSTDSGTLTWILEQIHPHWGRDGRTNEGSEHYMQGVAYPMEVHLVHYNSKYASFGAAVQSGNKDALLVVGVMMQLGSTDLNIVTVLANQISSLTQKKTPLPSQVQVSDFFDGTGQYYSYRGSLTTPGCNEIVTWVVLKGTKPITEATLNKFKAATINPAAAGKKFNTLATAGTYGVFGNYRPIQPLQGRTVYVSDGASVACASYTEAQATCTSGVLFSGPSVVIQLLALVLAVTMASRE